MTYFTPALWTIVLAAATVFATLGWRRSYDRARYFRRAAACIVIGAVVVPALAVVPAGHRGVVYRLSGGVAEDERAEGLTILVPWAERLIPVSVRTQKVFSNKVYAQSRDLQEITVIASVNYRVNPSMAAELYRDVGTEYAETVIEPAMFQRVKAAVGQVAAVDFAENRSDLALLVRDELDAQLSGYGIVVEFVNIEDAIFDPEFIGAVKAKVVADEVASEQERLVAAEDARKRQAILQAEARAASVRIEADAQAKANRNIARSLTPELLEWRLLTTWSGILPTTLVTGGNGISFLIDGRASQQAAE